MSSVSKSLTVFAPAKINLFLHITGRLENNYHTLQSLVAFADIGDVLRLTPASGFSFNIQGPYAQAFSAADRKAGPDSSNLVVRAVWELARAVERDPQVAITLTKNLPLASGVGGGSADAAAAMWGMMELWGLSPQALPHLGPIMTKLGADIPACFECRPVMMEGIGDILSPVAMDEEIPVVLVNPQKFCPTADVFKGWDGAFAEPVNNMLENITSRDDLVGFLKAHDNVLTHAAVKIVPEIAFVLDALAHQQGCMLSRMSGSGATCFGLFSDQDSAMQAAENIAMRHPTWWVRAGLLNRPERY